MVKNIKLATGLYDKNVYVLADNDNLQIKIVGDKYTNADYYFKAKNGQKEFNLLFKDDLVEINSKDLVFGELKAKIVVMIKDKVVYEYRVENLIIQQLDNTIEVIPQFEEYKRQFEEQIAEITRQQAILNEKYKILQEFEKEIEQLKKLVYVMCNIGGNEDE